MNILIKLTNKTDSKEKNMLDFMGLIPDIIVVIIGGLLHAGGEKAIEFRRRRKLEKKYPIAGKYLTKFEDEINGIKSEVKAPLVLEQKGLSIKGHTEFESRVWLLDGQISEEGYIYGRYYAENLYDSGVGNFFLNIGIDGVMEGLWSGYDSINKKITSGKYEFIKEINVSIENITQEIVPKIMRIAEKQLGDTYINEQELSENEVSLYAKAGNEVLGFCIGKVIETNQFLKQHKTIAERNNKVLNSTTKIGVLSSIAVNEKSKGRGVGTQLMNATLAAFESLGIKIVVMTGWKSSKGIHIGGLAKIAKFDELFEVPNYWYDDSIKNNYKCPECGNPPCKCSAVLFLKHI